MERSRWVTGLFGWSFVIGRDGMGWDDREWQRGRERKRDSGLRW